MNDWDVLIATAGYSSTRQLAEEGHLNPGTFTRLKRGGGANESTIDTVLALINKGRARHGLPLVGRDYVKQCFPKWAPKAEEATTTA